MVLPQGTDENVTLAIVEDEAGLLAIEEDWNDLFAACERPSLCASSAWVGAWWQAYGGRPEGVGAETGLFVLAFRDEEGLLVGIVPFVEDRPISAMRARRLRILGYVGQNGVFDMTEEPTLLVRPGWEAHILAETAEALRPGLTTGRWDAVEFRLHAERDAVPLLAVFGSLRSVANVRAKVRAGSDYVELPETWSEYRKSMTRSMRDNLPYYPRLLTRDGHDWQVRLLRAPDEMPGASMRLAELHRARSESEKGVRHDSHIQGAVQEAFLSGLLRRFASEGGATVAELLVDGRVVASQAFIESGDTMMVSYSGYDEAWYRYSPIFVLDAIVFKDALERGIRRLDFLRNPAPWKSRWLAAPGPPMHRALLVSRRLDSRLRYGLFWVGQAAKRNVRDRAPVLTRDLATRLRELKTSIERAMIPALPMMGRIGTRFAPTVHWALVQAPLHHR